MILPQIKRIAKEDLGPEAPTWIDRILSPLNTFFDTLYRGLNKNITFSENIDCQFYTFTITAGAAATDNTLKFIQKTNSKPNYLIPLNVSVFGSGNVYSATNLSLLWFADGAQININSISGLTDGTKYQITILILTK